jgi:hypothetical protein
MASIWLLKPASEHACAGLLPKAVKKPNCAAT